MGLVATTYAYCTMRNGPTDRQRLVVCGYSLWTLAAVDIRYPRRKWSTVIVYVYVYTHVSAAHVVGRPY